VRNGASSFFKLLLKPSRQHWFHDVPRALDKKIRRTWRTLQVPQALRDVHHANRMAAQKYVLLPYAGKVTLVRATVKPLEGIDPHAVWKDWRVHWQCMRSRATTTTSCLNLKCKA